MSNQIRTWCFTTFDFDNFKVPIENRWFRYCVFQHERCPDTDKLHIQGYIEFTRSMRMSAVKKACNDDTMHLEPRQGTREQARAYCMKEDTREAGPFEHGTWDISPGTRNELAEFCKAADEGKPNWEIKESFPSQFLRYQKHLMNYKNCAKPCYREAPEVWYLHGLTGTGKTKFVFDVEKALQDLYVIESECKWFDGYDGQPAVLFDDFNGQCKIEFMLRLLDRYPMQVPVKGGFVNWKPLRIYITSNVELRKLYPMATLAHLDALERRITSTRYFPTQLEQEVELINTLTDD